jgi:hypothetical protein
MRLDNSKARCNGCEYERLKWELGDKFLALTLGEWVEVYELDAQPRPGQGNPQDIEGIPVRWHASFMAVEHSDECYNWKPPDGGS